MTSEDEPIPEKPFNPASRRYRCCCNRFHVLNSSFFIAWISSLFMGSIFIAGTTALSAFYETIHSEGVATRYFLKFCTAWSGLWLFVTLILYIGLRKKLFFLLIPFLMYQFFQIFASIGAIIYTTLFTFSDSNNFIHFATNNSSNAYPDDRLYKLHLQMNRLILDDSVNSTVNLQQNVFDHSSQEDLFRQSLTTYSFGIIGTIGTILVFSIWFFWVVSVCLLLLWRLRVELSKIAEQGAKKKEEEEKEEVPDPSCPRYSGVFRSRTSIPLPAQKQGGFYLDQEDPRDLLYGHLAYRKFSTPLPYREVQLNIPSAISSRSVSRNSEQEWRGLHPSTNPTPSPEIPPDIQRNPEQSRFNRL